jgi:nitroreductase
MKSADKGGEKSAENDLENGFLGLARRRQSVRGYSDRPVEKEKILRCLEAARLAPSACNAQPWKFIVVDDPALKSRVAAETTSALLPLNRFADQAPVHVVLVLEPGNLSSKFGSAVKDKYFPLIDAGIAAEHFCLQAADDGLGTCMLGWFDEKGVSEILGIPPGKRPVLVITLGYPSDAAVRPKTRKSVGEMASFNHY